MVAMHFENLISLIIADFLFRKKMPIKTLFPKNADQAICR